MKPSVSPERTGYERLTAHPRRLAISSLALEGLGGMACLLVFVIGRGQILEIPLGVLGPIAIAVGLFNQVVGWAFQKSGEEPESRTGSNIPIVFKEESIPKTK